MKKLTVSCLGLLSLLLAACTFVPSLGMKEQRWLRRTLSHDLVYIEGNVKAYRSSGSYYYFRNGTLAAVNPALLPADRVPGS